MTVGLCDLLQGQLYFFRCQCLDFTAIGVGVSVFYKLVHKMKLLKNTQFKSDFNLVSRAVFSWLCIGNILHYISSLSTSSP
jgi:hypothetical protein